VGYVDTSSAPAWSVDHAKNETLPDFAVVRTKGIREELGSAVSNASPDFFLLSVIFSVVRLNLF
jgi:hypothetical protein